MPISRRQFLQRTMGAAAAIGLAPLLNACTTDDDLPPGSLLGPDYRTGHLLRNGTMPHPKRWAEVPILIVGGGMSGLSAGYSLHKKKQDYLLLELEDETGGNARSGQNNHTAYPWGAHYLPLPNAEAVHVRELLEEMSLITGYRDGLPVYDERALVHEPEERLLYRGIWQRGLLPTRGAPARTLEEYKRFFAEVERHRQATDSQGRPHFALPLELSSPDGPRQLDEISFAQYLNDHDYHSQELLWYLDYCCRDDYGSTLAQTSAWAGLHYHAGRRGLAANADPDSELTWPEGNAHIARYLHSRQQGHIRTGRLVYRLERTATGWEAMVYDKKNKTTEGYRCGQIIYAGPLHTLSHVYAQAPTLPRLLHTPWLIAQVQVPQPPGGTGMPLCWDNVDYQGKGLGYVLANHQLLSGHLTTCTLTYYRPLTDVPPDKVRRWAQGRSYGQWASMVLDELNHLHPGLRSQVQQLDLWIWGHGMVAPTPGYLWGAARQSLLQPQPGGLHLAHTDVAGISIFEEAQYHGIRCAQQAMQQRQSPL